MSAKLWKLLSSYEWKKPEKGDPEWYEENWDDKTHMNKARSWEAFASHYVDGVREKGYQQDTTISLESWHDGIHGLVGTGRYPGHMGDPAIAAVRRSIPGSRTVKSLILLLVRSHFLAAPLVSKRFVSSVASNM